MAIDTANKRRAAYWGMGVFSIAPVPDGTLAAADRTQVLWLYSLLAAAAVAAEVPAVPSVPVLVIESPATVGLDVDLVEVRLHDTVTAASSSTVPVLTPVIAYPGGIGSDLSLVQERLHG